MLFFLMLMDGPLYTREQIDDCLKDATQMFLYAACTGQKVSIVLGDSKKTWYLFSPCIVIFLCFVSFFGFFVGVRCRIANKVMTTVRATSLCAFSKAGCGKRAGTFCKDACWVLPSHKDTAGIYCKDARWFFLDRFWLWLVAYWSILSYLQSVWSGRFVVKWL